MKHLLLLSLLALSSCSTTAVNHDVGADGGESNAEEAGTISDASATPDGDSSDSGETVDGERPYSQDFDGAALPDGKVPPHPVPEGGAGAPGKPDGAPDATVEPGDGSAGSAGSDAGTTVEGGPEAKDAIPDGWLSLPDGRAYPPPPAGETYPPGCPEDFECQTWQCGAQDHLGNVGAKCCFTICQCGADWGNGCEKLIKCGYPGAGEHCLS